MMCNECSKKAFAGGARITPYVCPICKANKSYFCTSIPKVCEKCSKLYKICDKCGKSMIGLKK